MNSASLSMTRSGRSRRDIRGIGYFGTGSIQCLELLSREGEGKNQCQIKERIRAEGKGNKQKKSRGKRTGMAIVGEALT